MIRKQKCENNHKMIIDWEAGHVADRKCFNDATKYTVDNFGIFYLRDECYSEDCKRRLDSEWLSISDEDT